MWIALIMGLRNLRRRLSRTLLTLAALMLGAFMLVSIVALNEGTFKGMVTMSTSTWSGQLQVLHKDYSETPSLFKAIDEPQPVLAMLEQMPDVIAATARVEAAGLFSAGTRTAGGMITGVVPGQELKVATLPNTITRGTFLGETTDPEALPIVLGKGLARRLELKLGDEVVYMGQAADGSMAAEVYEVVGLLDSGIDEMDASMALIRLEDAQELFVLGERVHRIVARTSSAYTVDDIAARLVLPDPIVAMTWSELMPEVSSGIDQKRSSGSILVVIILLMVMLGTVNTLMMSVFERTRELGVMKALGTPSWQIVGMIMWEGAWLSIIGVGLGVALASLLVLYLQIDGLQMLDQPVDFAGMQIQVIRPANTIIGNILYPLVLILGSILGAIWPAYRASQLDPVAALREL